MIINSLDSYANINGIDIRSKDFIFQYIPLAKIFDQPQSNPDISLLIDENQKTDISYPYFFIGKCQEKEVIAAAGYGLRRALEEKGVYSISASSAAVNGNGLVFFGAMPDLGKTLLSLELAKRGHEFIADERVLLREGMIIGGVQYFKVRKDWQYKSFQKDRLVDAKEVFKVSTQAKIAAFVYPEVSDCRLNVNEWNNEKAFWHIQDGLSRSLRGCSSFIDNYSNLLPSIDTGELSEKRIAYARQICKDTPAFHIKGKPVDVVKFLEGKFG